MPTNPNMVAIQTVTVGAGGAASIDFQNIPATYTDLKVVVSARANGSSAVFYLRFNNDSANNYSVRRLVSNGSTATSSSGSSESSITFLIVNDSGSTASTFGNTEIYVPNYTSSNQKSVSIDTLSENNGTTAFARLMAGLYTGTATISRLTLIADGTENFVQYSTATLYGVTSAGYGAKATGGIISSDANYWYHTFTASGTFTPTQNLTCDYLVVAGGGSGGANNAGGGGAGGLRCTVGATGGGGSLESALSLTASTNYTVTIGAGGAGVTGDSGGSNGSNSVFSTITSTGGGAGAGVNGNNGASGGSGGGASSNGNLFTGGAGTTNQGYAGSNVTGGGGAGGGGAGGTTSGTTAGSAGGIGVQTSISGTATYYAGGGGGAGHASGNTGGGAGGNGGGGAGGTSTNGTNGTAGTANTGGGGGAAGGGAGGGVSGTSGNGGSGIVIVRYAK